MNVQKKPIRLFNWRQTVVLILAAIGGMGLNAYRTYQAEGALNTSWFVTAAITLLVFGAVIFFVVRHANKPEKER